MIKAAKRKSLPKSAFVYPKVRKYPIDTLKRARAALSYGARKNTYGSLSTIRAKVYKRYPALKKRAQARGKKK